MSETLIVSGRGQITLPASVRKRFGIHPGDVMILDDRTDELVLRPAVVMEIETYTDERIAQWAEEDRFQAGEREELLRKLGSTG